jgi:hypothetical protein
MAFRPLKYEEGKLVSLPCAITQTIVKGDALADNGAGLLAVATSATAVDVHYIAMQTVTTTVSGQLVLCLETENVLFEADTNAAWLQPQVGTYVDLASVSTLDSTATTNQLFYILKGVGVAGTDKVVLGYFTRGIPNS